MELDVLPVGLWHTYRRVFGDDAEIVDCSPQLLAVRSRKSEWELDQFRDAARIHPLLFADPLRRLLAEDVSPYDLELRLEAEARALGHCGLVRLRGLDVETGIGIAVSGPDGAVPSNSMFPIGGTGPHAWVSHGGTRAPIRRDVPIILDFLMSTTGYHVDCSRMAVYAAPSRIGRHPSWSASAICCAAWRAGSCPACGPPRSTGRRWRKPRPRGWAQASWGRPAIR